jgi:hypothetical protein
MAYQNLLPGAFVVYNTIVVPASNGTALTLGAGILALSGGALPTGRRVIGGIIIPLSTGPGMAILGCEPGASPLAAVAGGGAWTIGAGATFDLLPQDPLYRVFMRSLTTAATSCDLLLFLERKDNEG